ncbi:MAG TPA: organomercurial lyase [Verrucomicrobiae bacterium]|nr:organomercurial lyase [Verrucomicrobiae bacterium]
MDFDTRVKVAIYTATAESGRVPALADVAHRVQASPEAVTEAFARLRASRLLWLEPDGITIRIAPPFSAVPTQHLVSVAGIDYFATCAWDALGIVAALRQTGVVHSRCEQSLEPLELDVPLKGPDPSPWLFHCLVPAAKWWDDLVFT